MVRLGDTKGLWWSYLSYLIPFIDLLCPLISPWIIDVFFYVSLRVCGSYTDMNAGLPSEACKDFCGGVNVDYKLQEVHSGGHDDELWSSLSNASSCNSMICCGTAQKGVRTHCFRAEKGWGGNKPSGHWCDLTCLSLSGCVGEHCIQLWYCWCTCLFCHSSHWGKVNIENILK